MPLGQRSHALQTASPRERRVLRAPETAPSRMTRLGCLIGNFTTEVGIVNQILQIRGRAEVADRGPGATGCPGEETSAGKDREQQDMGGDTLLTHEVKDPS